MRLMRGIECAAEQADPHARSMRRKNPLAAVKLLAVHGRI
jgi:hypothetical protein